MLTWDRLIGVKYLRIYFFWIADLLWWQLDVVCAEHSSAVRLPETVHCTIPRYSIVWRRPERLSMLLCRHSCRCLWLLQWYKIYGNHRGHLWHLKTTDEIKHSGVINSRRVLWWSILHLAVLLRSVVHGFLISWPHVLLLSSVVTPPTIKITTFDFL